MKIVRLANTFDNHSAPGNDAAPPFMKIREFLTLNCVHFMIDAYASTYGLVAAVVRLSPDMIGFVGTAFSLAANSSQLLMGVVSDRRDLRRFIIVGLMATAVFIPLAGFLSDIPAVFPAALVLGGLGVAAFHPPGAVVAARMGKHRATFFVGIFVTVGSLGYAVGPVLYTAFISTWDVERSYLLVIPGLLLSLVAMWMFRKSDGTFAPSRSTSWSIAEAQGLLREHGKKIVPLFLCVVARSVVFLTMAFYLPTILIARGQSEADASLGHLLFCAAGSVGTMVIGSLVGKVNRRWIQVGSLLIGIPCGLVFLYSGVSLTVNFIGLGLCGFIVLSTNAMHVVMGQEISRDHASTLSSLMMGFGWGVGGLASTLTGALVGTLGVDNAVGLTILLPLVVLPLVGFLEPYPRTVLATDG
jgi:FSR family fosmidomycin resistance protein-like MFS transporter